MSIKQCVTKKCDFCKNKEKCDREITKYEKKKKEKKTL